MDSGAWQATVHGVTESDMTKGQSTHAVDKCHGLLLFFLFTNKLLSL